MFLHPGGVSGEAEMRYACSSSGCKKGEMCWTLTPPTETGTGGREGGAGSVAH